MRIVFDTNVILDAVLERGNYEAAKRLMRAVADEKIGGIVTANTITDIFYVAKKLVGDEMARKFIANILALFDVAPVDGDVCAEALTLPIADYEDAVLAACAIRENADRIATEDRAFLMSESPVSVERPEKLVEMVEE